jgi:RHS repeat-associated protein
MLSKSSTTYTYNNLNQLTKAGSTDDYTYTGNGNLASREAGSDTWTYTYDYLNRLRTVRKNSVLQGSSVYDADGRRVQVWDPSDGWAVNLYSGLNVICEVPSTGVGDSSVHLYAGALHIASIVGGVSEYLHQDHLGSTRLRTDSAGNVVYGVGYQPYGVEQGEVGSERFKYTGKPEDESTGLYYYGARYYDPSVGRFITEDTVLGSLTDPQSLNRYVYCRSNPLKYTDPDGRFWNIVAGSLIGGSINLAFYAIDSRISGREMNVNEAVTTFACGAISGALMGATMGALAPGGFLAKTTLMEKVMIKAASSLAGDLAETTTDLVINNLRNDPSGNNKAIGSYLGSSSIDVGLSSIEFINSIEQATIRTGETGIFGQMLIGKVVTKSIETIFNVLDSQIKRNPPISYSPLGERDTHW